MMRRGLVVAACVACGGPARVEIQPNASAATCNPAELDGEPLVVDLGAMARADLDGALSRGIVAVKYDCGGVKVLPDCTAEGQYAYVGVTEKEQVTRFASASELRANFPTEAARLERTRAGRELDFGVAIVGSLTAQRSPPARADFKGRCDGATHFIRRATVGAFAIGFNTPGAKVDVESLVASGQEHDGFDPGVSCSVRDQRRSSARVLVDPSSRARRDRSESRRARRTHATLPRRNGA